MIFCDMGVNPTPWGFSAYDEIIEKLTARGIPHEQIAVIGDADSDAKKKALFDRVRSGQVRVLIGSTTKMGTGTNVQKRLIALHHLDAPWKPAEVEQREGRILRQGNENPEVAIYRYVTSGSFDAFMWQTLETKARFINQIMTGDTSVRKADDIGGQELSYAEVKAIASGNPAVLTLAEADAELQRLTVLRRNHSDEQFLARRRKKELPDMIGHYEKRIAGLTADMETMDGNDGITIAGRSYSHKDAVAVLGGVLDSLPLSVYEKRYFPLGTYRGLKFGIELNPNWSPAVVLEGAVNRHDALSRDSHGPRAVLNAVERIAGSYGGERKRTEQDLEVAQNQLRGYESRIGQPFEHEGYLKELESLRDRLRLSLSGTPAEGEPTAADLAEKIKALKAANVVEAAPQRTGKRTTSAEEPVTARIRRREAENATDASPSEPTALVTPAIIAEQAVPVRETRAGG